MQIRFRRKNIIGLMIQVAGLISMAAIFYFLKEYSINNQNERTWAIVTIVANSVVVAIAFYGYIFYEIASSIISYCKSPDSVELIFDDKVLRIGNYEYKTNELTCLVEESLLILGSKKFRYAICLLKGKKEYLPLVHTSMNIQNTK